MKTIRACFFILVMSLFIMPACVWLEARRIQPESQYTLETNDEYAVIWNRTDVSMTLNDRRPAMVGAPGIIIVLGQDKKELVSSGEIYGINSLTGKDVWKTSAGFGTIIATNEQVYYGTVGLAKVKSYDIENGELLWDTSLPEGGKAVSTLYFANGKVFAYTHSFRFFVLSEDGKILRNLDLNSSYDVYLEVNNVRYMNDNLAIRAVDSSSMQELWRAKVGPYDADPIFDDGTIFVVAWRNSYNAYVYSINQTTGEINWKISDEVLSNLYLARDKIYFMNRAGYLVALDRATGNEISRVKFLPEIDLNTPQSGGFFVAGDPANDVIAVSFANNDQIMGIEVLNP